MEKYTNLLMKMPGLKQRRSNSSKMKLEKKEKLATLKIKIQKKRKCSGLIPVEFNSKTEEFNTLFVYCDEFTEYELNEKYKEHSVCPDDGIFPSNYEYYGIPICSYCLAIWKTMFKLRLGENKKFENMSMK